MATTNAVTTETLNNVATFLFKMQMACNFIGRLSYVKRRVGIGVCIETHA